MGGGGGEGGTRNSPMQWGAHERGPDCKKIPKNPRNIYGISSLYNYLNFFGQLFGKICIISFEDIILALSYPLILDTECEAVTVTYATWPAFWIAAKSRKVN